MPLARSILLILCCIAIPTFLTFLSLLSTHPRHDAATESSPAAQKGGIRSFLSFHTPSSLFPPSAIISLTDDNSTFFLARPADFGPQLISRGLSGQLWVGSGFGDDNLGKGGATSGAEGELGCSDVPGWENDKKSHREILGQSGRLLNAAAGDQPSSNRLSNTPATGVPPDKEQGTTNPSSQDGTDNYLHHPLPESQVSKPASQRRSEKWQASAGSSSGQHADIQSLQETAEITGKIALLSRGGCGFLEKAKWAQRRGAAALIVGDDTRGGALVTMYARGDTSNITIPSLFTSHTTAHLLSSLIPPEGYPDDNAEDGDDLEAGHGDKGHEILGQEPKPNPKADNDRPMFTSPSPRPKATLTGSSNSLARKKLPSKTEKQKSSKSSKKSGWFKSLFGGSKRADDTGLTGDSRRPPSSGRLSWINERWNDELLAEQKVQKSSSSMDQSRFSQKSTLKSDSHHPGDGFEIGVQDWRDPDLVMTKTSPSKGKDGSKVKAPLSTAPLASTQKQHDTSKKSLDGKALSGGSITPGSGEYRTPGHSVQAPSGVRKSRDKGPKHADDTNEYSENDEENWFSRVLWGDEDDEDAKLAGSSNPNHLQHHPIIPTDGPRLPKSKDVADISYTMDDEEHDGLWVTLSPTTVSTTPFFDTLLVLVVSPLVTLTVVYVLLLIRSRMRRRRWRAPKSVVEQLPVRTYQTMSSSSTTASTRLASPFASSPTSPLLQSSARPAAPRPRSRTRTASGLDDAVSASLDKATARASARQDKPLRKYKGKQIECVVCLEEYVEGHSQVMSLPCGHEFHADCM
jgi:hypothetical protein